MTTLKPVDDGSDSSDASHDETVTPLARFSGALVERSHLPTAIIGGKIERSVPRYPVDRCRTYGTYPITAARHPPHRPSQDLRRWKWVRLHHR